MTRDGGGDDDQHWHLDRRVPLGIIFTIAVQTVVFIVVATSWKLDVDHRLDTLEKTDVSRVSHADRITVLEQKFSFIADTLIRIERGINRESAP